FPKTLVLQGVDEIGHCAARAFGEQLQRPPQRCPLCGARRDALQVDKDLDPLLGPTPLVAPVDPRKWREGQAALVVAGDVVVLGAAGVCEHVCRVVLIEEEYLGAGVAEELSHEQSNQRRLAGARWPEDQGVADVADMEIQAKGRRAGGGCVAERRTRW